MMNGTYICRQDREYYRVRVKETDKGYTLTLLEDRGAVTRRWMIDHKWRIEHDYPYVNDNGHAVGYDTGSAMTLMFNDKMGKKWQEGKTVTVKKSGSPHGIKVWEDDSFTLYPGRAGLPYVFCKE